MNFRKILAIILGFVFFVVGIATLSHYGSNSDSVNHLPRGQAYLHFFLTGKKDFGDLPKWLWYWQKSESLTVDSNIPKEQIPRRSQYTLNATFGEFLASDGNGHPPLSDILSAFFNEVLFVKLGLVNDIDSYRVYGILLAAILVGLVFWWAAQIYGKFAGLVAALSLALYPLFWSHSHFNTEKDVPETVFWSFMLFSVWFGVTRRDWRWLSISGIFFGLALGTKFNILFSIFVILPWVVVYLVVSKKINEVRRIFPVAIGALLIGLVIFVVTWPFLWQDPLSGVSRIIAFYKGAGISTVTAPRFSGPFNIDFYAGLWILYITPLITLFLFSFGILTAISRLKTEKDKISLLFFLWLLIPIARATWPGAFIHGGVRQIMEYIPAMALLAGLGGSVLRDFLAVSFLKITALKMSYSKLLSACIVLSLFIPIFVKIVQIHPNEGFYFNPLVGGLAGAKKRQFPNWGESYGETYRQGVQWINENAPNGATVVFAYELMPNIPRIFLRTDLEFTNTRRSGYLRQGEYAITLISQGTDTRSYYDMYLERFIKPVYEVKVDGVSILKVWKNDDAHLKISPSEEKDESILVTPNKSGIMIDIGEVRKLARLEIEYFEEMCQPVDYGLVQISVDGQEWDTLPGSLPDAWRISAIGAQPKDGQFIEPFVGQEARFINLLLSPDNACLKNIQTARLYIFNS